MKRLVSVSLCLAFAFFCAAEDIRTRLEAYLPAATASELAAKGYVQKSRYREPGTGLALAPSLSLAQEASGYWEGQPAAFLSESLYLYRKPAARQCAPGGEIQKISQLLRSLSALEGIQYYSASRKKMHTLYEKSYAVQSASARIRIADPVSGSADGKVIWAVQKDTTFGEFLYRYGYRQTDSSVAFFSSNADAMTLSFIKLIDPGKLRISLVVQDMGDSLLFYSITRADFANVPGIEGKLTASFSNRVDAIYKWFIGKYEAE
jgi:hypothetical protein